MIKPDREVIFRSWFSVNHLKSKMLDLSLTMLLLKGDNFLKVARKVACWILVECKPATLWFMDSILTSEPLTHISEVLPVEPQLKHFSTKPSFHPNLVQILNEFERMHKLMCISIHYWMFVHWDKQFGGTNSPVGCHYAIAEEDDATKCSE